MLRWPDLDRVPPELRPRLTGPGAPFELVREDVRGVEMTVFANRPKNLVAVLKAAAREHADRPYLVLPDRTITYGEAATTARAVAGVLRHRHGVGRGDRVALAGANSAEHALTIWGVILLGGVVVGLNGWWTGPELAHGLALTEPRLLVADEPRLARLAGTTSAGGLPTVSFEDLAAAATGSAASAAACPAAGPDGGRAAGPDGGPSAGPDAVPAAGPDAGPVASPDAVPAADPESGPAARPEVGRAGPDVGLADVVAVDLDEDEPFAVLFTSGTTGRPKGALISHRGIINFGLDAALRGAVEVVAGAAPAPKGPPVSVLASPFFHISGLGPLIGAAPRSGMTLVFPPAGRWDPAAHLRLTAEHGVTQWSGVPTQILRLLEHPDLDAAGLAGIRGIGCGGAAMPADLPRVVAARLPGAVVTNGYGMTETCGLGTAISGPRLLAHPGSAGVATPTAEVMLRDADGTEITVDGAVGEIWLRCPSTFLGYWGDEAATAAVLDGDGWYRTGDFGRFADGLLHVESRLRDLIIRGGENIYPIEVENRLVEHPGIAEAAVIGVAHRELGQEVLAVVVAREGSVVDPDEVRGWVAASLATFKVPAHVRIVDALPYSASGKVLKRDLEARFHAHTGATGLADTDPELAGLR